jgi:hypothetical protein
MKIDALTPHKFLDGPLAGREMALPRGTESYPVGPVGCPFLTYEYAGKDGLMVLLAKRQSKRSVRRLVMRYIATKGKHPALMALGWRKVPIRGKTVKTGKGAAARAARAAVK